MLIQMDIENLVTIEKSSILFSTGLTAITGETGTGKSILMDAIDLALGGRATEQWIRPGCERAEIALCFDIRELPQAKRWLHSHDLESTHECILRRVLSRDGRSRSFINGVPFPVSQLRVLAEHLIQMHGQHEQQSLLQTDMQLNLLDIFAGTEDDAETLGALSRERTTLQTQITTLKTNKEKNQAERDWLQFQLDEFKQLHIEENTFRQLDQEHQQLTHADALLQNTSRALHLITEGEENAQAFLHQALSALESVQHADPMITDIVNTIRTTLIPLKEIETDLRHYPDKLELDAERLTQVEARLSALFNLARKYKIKPEDLFHYQQDLSARLSNTSHGDAEITHLIEQLEAIEKKYLNLAKDISEKRKTGAQKLAKNITTILKPLALEKAEFKIQFEPATTSFSSTGQERVIFLISTNPGQPLQPLAQVASGGELSRISLAIHIATARQHTVPTLVFDEIDTGISGGTAEKVGKLLRLLANVHQVLCVTHAPQVAAQAHQHLIVKKETQNNATRSTAETLTHAARIQELARMLGGIEITEKTLAHAQEMMAKAQAETVND
ncbi:MAG: DNA repair protein RecN [Gammaproteobacteria bacterium]|nr:DNA repair protein RecN [Gammaproteobacteria bacterium]